MSSILIAGGSGMIGSALSRSLMADGHKVSVLSRTPDHRSTPIQYRWNPSSEYIDEKAIQDVDVVINLCGAGIADKLWTRKRRLVLSESRLVPTRFLASLWKDRERKPAMYIGASAIGIYGDQGDKILDENSVSETEDFMVKLCRDWEGHHWKLEESGMEVSIMRIGLVLSDSGGLLPKLMSFIFLKSGAILGSGDQYMSWIHHHDLVDLFKWVINGNLPAGIYNTVGPDPVQHREFMHTLKRSSSKLSFLASVPTPILKLVMGEMSATVLSSVRVLPSKALTGGFNYRFEKLENAMGEVLRAMST